MFSFMMNEESDEISSLKKQLQDIQKQTQKQEQQKIVDTQLSLPGSALWSLDAAGGGPLYGMIDEFTVDSQSQAGRLTKLESEGGTLKAMASLASSAAQAYAAYATAGASTAVTAGSATMDAATFASGGLNPAYNII